MRNIFIIPTDKPSKLYTVNSIGKLDWSHDYLQQVDNGTNKHIYITSDKEIKEGDYFYQDFDCIIHKCYKLSDNYVIAEKPSDYPKKICKKIILTTDQDLIKDGVQAIDDEFLEWFVKNPSCKEVEVELKSNEFIQRALNIWGHDEGLLQCEYETYIKEYGAYKIIIPKEEPCDNCNNEVCCCIIRKQETLEEAVERIPREVDFSEFDEVSFNLGVKWQAERSYSEEDLKLAFESAREFDSLDGVVDIHIVLPMGGDMSDLQPLHFTFEEWFEKFKKK